jgi:hypothetical protein
LFPDPFPRNVVILPASDFYVCRSRFRSILFNEMRSPRGRSLPGDTEGEDPRARVFQTPEQFNPGPRETVGIQSQESRFPKETGFPSWAGSLVSSGEFMCHGFHIGNQIHKARAKLWTGASQWILRSVCRAGRIERTWRGSGLFQSGDRPKTPDQRRTMI